MLLSYKWDGDGDGDGDRDRKSLCGATIRASLCDANKLDFVPTRGGGRPNPKFL